MFHYGGVRHMKRLFPLICVLLCFSFFGCQKEKPKEEIYLVFTSDVHCGVEDNFTMASVKAYVDDLKEEHDNVLLLDTGDYIQGGTIGSLSKGAFIIDVMNETGYDYVTIGNHEFDYGMEVLSSRLGEMKMQPIVSNVIYTGSGTNVFEGVPEYVIVDFNGTKLGILGILTPESLTSSTPAHFMEDGQIVYNFYSGNHGNDLYDHIQELTDEMRSKGADYVIAMSHLGSTQETYPYDSISLIAHTSGIDAIMDGHSHSLIVEDMYPNKNGEDVLLSSVGTKLQEVGTLIIDKDGNMSFMHMLQYDKQDETVLNKIAQINGGLEQILSEKVGETAFDLSITDEEGIRMVRSRETGIGDLVADAFRLYDNADIGIVNGGGVRTSIPAGEITYGTLLNVHPFQNSYSLIKATGQELLDAMEYAYRGLEPIYKFDGNPVGEGGSFWCLSGMKVTIDTSIESPVVQDANGFFDHFEGDQRRVCDVYVLEDGEYVPIDPEKEYLVAGIDYVLLNNGDGNTLLNDCEVLVGTGVSDVEVLKSYVEKYGIDEKYAEPQGRIIVR